MIIDKRLTLNSPVTAIVPVEGERVAIVDGDGGVRFFKSDPIELLGGFKTLLPQTPNLSNGTDVSKDGRYAAFSVKNEGAVLLSVLHKRLLYRFNRHEGDVESVKIDDYHNYLATGGQDGKTFLWSLTSGRLVTSLPHHADFVIAIDFSPNGQWIATGGFDRKILVSNISSLGRHMRLTGHKGAITTLRFISDHRLVAGDKSGEVTVWDYFEGKVLKRLPKMLDEVTSLCTTPDDRFLFVSDKTGIVALYDLSVYDLVVLRYLSYVKPIREIAYLSKGNYLIVGLANGEVTFNAPLKESTMMERAIDEGDLKNAYELVEENPLLRYSDAYAKLEALWNDAYEEAVELLEKELKDEAKKVLEPFSVESTKRLISQRLVNDYKEFEKFKNAVIGRKYPLAYSLAEQYPMLKYNRYYEKMEKEWEKAFAQAKKVILSKGGEERAKELLSPFRGISSKSVLIQTLLAEKEIYRLFMKMVVKKDYKGAIELAKRYPAIQELEEYRKVERVSNAIAQRALENLEMGNYAETARLASKLMEFPDRRKEAEALKEKANLYASAMRYFAEKNYAVIYKMLEEFPYLEETRIVRDLEEVWRKVVSEAENYAAKGETLPMRKILAPFINLAQKKAKIVSLFKLAYLEQIERYAGEKSQTLENAIRKYLEIFGMDDLIESWLRIHQMVDRFPKTPERRYDVIDIANLPEKL